MENNHSLILFEAQSGALSAKLERQDGTTLHIHSLVDPEQEYKFFANLSISGDCIILAGTGLGYHLLEHIENSFCGKKIVILEYFPEFAQHCANLIEKIIGLQPVLITSECKHPLDLLKQYIDNSGMVQIVKHPASYRAQKSFYDFLLSNIHKYKKKNNNRKASVILYGKFFLQEEIANAISKTGDKYVKLNYGLLHDSVEYEQLLQKTINEENPEMFISVNMLGFDGNGILSEYASRNGIPIAVWFVDDPRPILLSQKNFITKNMVAFCWEREYIDELKRSGFNCVHYLPLATDPDLFKLSDCTVNKSVNIGFVGTSMAGEFRKSLISKFLWNRNLEPLVTEVALNLINIPVLNVDYCISDYCKKNNKAIPFDDDRNQTWLRSYIIHTAGMIKRQRLVEALRDSGLEVFGDLQGWRDLSGDGFVCHKNIDYRTGLAEVYRSILINVNITSCQMMTAVNQRVFDIPSCGSFLLTDYQKDLDELFTSDEVVIYHSLEDLKDLAAYYQKNDAAREMVVSLARTRILKEHTYERRYERIKKLTLG